MKSIKVLILMIIFCFCTPQLVFADQLEGLGAAIQAMIIGSIILLVLFVIGFITAVKYFRTKSRNALIGTLIIISLIFVPIFIYLSNDGDNYDLVFKLSWILGLALTLITILQQRTIKENPTKITFYILNLFLWLGSVSYLFFQMLPIIGILVFPICIFFYSKKWLIEMPSIGFKKLWSKMIIISLSSLLVKFIMPFVGGIYFFPLSNHFILFRVPNYYLSLLVSTIVCLFLVSIATGIQFKLSQNRLNE